MPVRRAWFITFLAVVLCADLFPQENQHPLLALDESKIEFHLFPDLGVNIALSNQSDHMLEGTLLLEILADDSNEVVDQVEKVLTIAPGSQTENVELVQKPLYRNPLGLGGYRLRYKITPRGATSFDALGGIVQLGPHIVDGFAIYGYPDGEFECALDCRFMVRVAEPRSGRGLAGYDVRIDFGPDPGTIVNAITDKEGYAAIDYKVQPRDLAYDGVGMQVRVTRGPYSPGWGGNLWVKVPPHLTLTTDKSTYEPGQVVHLHIFLTGTDKRPWAGGNLSLTFSNALKEQELFKTKLVTSESGEATAEWTTPKDMEDGTLSVLATSADEPQGNWKAQSKVKIQVQKAVTPTLILNAVPDQAYYLPGQNAKLAVSGSELSGMPVRSGRVSIETGAYAPSKLQGDLDDSGKYIAHVDLKGMWDWLKKLSDAGWQGPHSFDFPVDVSLTDGATGKSESRNIVLHLAKQEVHLYVNDGFVAGAEKEFAIVSSYADGSPASVDGVVEATFPDADGRCNVGPSVSQSTKLGNFHTNRYGVARFTLPGTWIDYAYPKREDGPYSWYLRTSPWDAPNERVTRTACLFLQVSDHSGKTGALSQELPVAPESHFATRMSTDHALYRPGEPIHVQIESDAGLTEAVVEIRNSGQEMIGAEHLHLTHGRGDVVFSYNPQLRGLLTVQVFAVTGLGDPSPVDSWSREVVYPTGERLKAEEKWPTDIWRPDEVRPDNPRIMTILGEEDHGRIAGMEKADLLGVDPNKPLAEGLDLVAWALLGPTQNWHGWGSGYDSFHHEEFDKRSLAAVEPALRKLYTETGKSPTEMDIIRELSQAGIDFYSLRDGWGMPYRLVIRDGNIYLLSNGPDKTPDTGDDYAAAKIHLP